MRQALLVATQLGSDDFILWARSELDGYAQCEKEDLPQYRRLYAELRLETPRGLIPMSFNNTALDEMASIVGNWEPIGLVEELYSSAEESNYVQSVLNPAFVANVQRMFNTTNRPVCLVHRSELYQIMDGVRNQILRWAVELKGDGIVGENMTFSPDEQKRARGHTLSIGTLHMHGGIIGDISNSQIKFGNYQDWHSQLVASGVPTVARHELETLSEQAQSNDEKTRKSAVEKGLAWVAKWSQSLGTLAGAIKGFFDGLKSSE